ncbi:hypothetical protein ACVPOS_11920 [Staphylococcus aureus]
MISFKTQGPTVNKLYYAAGWACFRVQSIIYVVNYTSNQRKTINNVLMV